MLTSINNISSVIVNNGPAVVERYEGYYKTYIYDFENDWSAIRKYHETQCSDVLYLIVHVRETIKSLISYDRDEGVYLIKNLLESGIEPYRIRYIINYHSTVNQNMVRSFFKCDIPLLKVRYFELDSVLRHKKSNVLPQKEHCGGWIETLKSQSINYFEKYEKKFLCLFGKPYKYFRIGTVIHLHERGLIDDCILSLLIDGEGIDKVANEVSDFFGEKKVRSLLKELKGSPDDVIIKSPEKIQSHYLGYPYDTALYEKTFMSIISETNPETPLTDREYSPFFVTEKTARTIENYHPFVILSTDGFMEKLRDEMGYLTFNDIIDESYDTEKRGDVKIKKAIDSANEIVTKIDDPRIKEIVVYNKNHQRNVAETELKNINNFINL